MQLRGPDLLRVKGFLNVEGCRGPVVVQFVQHLAHPPVELQNWPDDCRQSRVVFITRNISERQVRNLIEAIRALAWGCSPAKVETLTPHHVAPLSGRCEASNRCARRFYYARYSRIVARCHDVNARNSRNARQLTDEVGTDPDSLGHRIVRSLHAFDQIVGDHRTEQLLLDPTRRLCRAQRHYADKEG